MFIKLYFASLITLFAIDMVWLTLVAKNLYAKQIGMLMKPEINWPATLIFYALFVAGIVFFVLNPAIEKQSWTYALLSGALFGLICYGTYDLTNLATLKNWPVLITVVDMVWGAVLCGAVSAVTYFIAIKFSL